MADTKSFNSGMSKNPRNEEIKKIGTSEETGDLEAFIEKLKSEIKFLKFQLEQNDSEIETLNMRIQSLENQIVQIIACDDPEKAQMLEQIKKDILAHDPTYFEHFVEHCSYSFSWDEVNKKV